MQIKQVEIICKNTGNKCFYPMGITLAEIAHDQNIKLRTAVCGALVNNKLKELSFNVIKSKTIEFVDMLHPDGRRMYIRSLLFIFYAAINELFPDANMSVEHGISNGYYAELKGLGRNLTETDISAIEKSMKEIIRKNYPFEKLGFPTEQAVAMLNEQGLVNKARLFEQQGTMYSYLYKMNGLVNYFYGHILPSTGYITNFGIELYHEGLLLKVPHPEDYKTLQDSLRQDKLFSIYQEHKDWAEILQVSTIAELNGFTINGKAGDIIKISEALHEKKVAEIANQISLRRGEVRVALVAGPSSSGKTTFSKRLGVQLAVNGLWPQKISLDDYFVGRELTPRDESGEYDFEALAAIDVDFFNLQLIDLMNGKEIEIPKFNFKTGKRYFDGHKLQLKPGNILIIEGIHGLNPGLLPHFDQKLTYKIFLSALTQVSVDEHTHISTSDNRLIRRMIRDSKYRGYSAVDTIKRWPLVRKGEEKNIFPYQENADIMFNSATLYELAVLKKYAEPLLRSVTQNREEYSESTRLLKFLSYFKPMDDREIPPTSLLREFLGGSSFTY